MKNLISYIRTKIDTNHILSLTKEWMDLVGDKNIIVSTSKVSEWYDDEGHRDNKMDWFDIEIMDPLNGGVLLHYGGTRRIYLDGTLKRLKNYTYREWFDYNVYK